MAKTKEVAEAKAATKEELPLREYTINPKLVTSPVYVVEEGVYFGIGGPATIKSGDKVREIPEATPAQYNNVIARCNYYGTFND